MDIASLSIGVVGLIVSLAGFTIAVRQIRKTRSAAEHAEEAANEAREALLQITSISDLSQASALIEQIKELHRKQELGRAIDKYTPLRQLLTVARARLPEANTNTFTYAIRQLVIMEEETDIALRDTSVLSELSFQSILLEMQQSLDEARVELERNLADTSNTGRQQT